MTDRQFMKQALKLARKGTGYVSPNPRVGAVIVKNKTIISKGYHARFGGPHAEVHAINQVDAASLKNSTLYVNLEPCSHTGKTPPCTERIIQSGIKTVVVGMQDPNPLVSGRGIQQLKEQGIAVRFSELEKECRELNKAFVKFIMQGMPYVTLKAGQTLDGWIAASNGASRWITNEKSRKEVHALRHECDAILVGIETVLKDNPSLDVRFSKKSTLKRFVLDSSLRIDPSSKIFQHQDCENTFVVTTAQVSESRVQAIQETGAQIWQCGQEKIELKSLLQKMAAIGIAHLLVEGGGQVHASFIRENLADRLLLYIAPKLFGAGVPSIAGLDIESPDQAIEFNQIFWKKFGDNMRFEGRFSCLQD